ncbi:hypothetical protein [Streptomyces sp. NPDC014744]|uniref:hypothetical protein n=1 Tax=Streptomyces sp. NPDC014744 TaxID=3364903 RepID=UPI0037008EB8
MSSHPENDPLPIRSLGTNPPDGYPSASLLARAQLGWNAFLARSGPLPGEETGR